MSRRNDNFDEFCDPNNPRAITYDDVLASSHRIRPYISHTACISAFSDLTGNRHFVFDLRVGPIDSGALSGKISFKERGALNTLLQLHPDQKKLGIVIASTGNEALAFCCHAVKFGIPVYVVVPNALPIDRLQTCYELGAKVMMQGTNLKEAQKFARVLARDKGLTYINARDHPHVLAGYGTMALEILEDMPLVDAVIVPVGTGGLAAATAAIIKSIKPACLVYGVEPEVMPVLTKSLEKREPTNIPYVVYHLADNIAVNYVGVNAFHNVKNTLDKMLLVKDDWIATAMLHLVEVEKFVVEGSGACPLAAIIGNLVPELKLKRVVCVLSGGNVDNIQLSRSLDRGMGVDGRLVKFSVRINNKPTSQAELLRLLVNGGYDVRHVIQDNAWTDSDTYTIELQLVCATKGLEHALELKRIVDKNYPFASKFEEPFNDRRTCPCYGMNSRKSRG